MPLDLGGLQQAVAALGRTLERSKDVAFMSAQDEITRNAIRAGVIQHFEFTYELCWKFMQRWLQNNVSPEEATHFRSRKDLFRLAAQKGLIADPLPWFDHAEARNLTAHTYNVDTAQTVWLAAGRFFTDARDFLERLERVND